MPEQRIRTTVRPERFVAGGDVLARDDDGRVVFVHGALPGETVDVEITETRSDWARGDVVTLVERSVHRVEPPCPHRLEGCGGCDWQHVDTAIQLDAKRDVVVDALRRTAKLPEAVVVSGGSVPPYAYRTTLRVVGTRGRRAGFRRERSHDTVEASGCLVAHPRLVELLATVEIDTGVEVTLRTSVATGETTAHWNSRNGEVRGLPGDVATGGRAAVHEDVAGHRLRVSAGSFFQSGPAAAERLVDAVRRAAPEVEQAAHVLDAYAGVGLFAVAATSSRSRVTAIESSRSAAADAQHNLSGRTATVDRRDVAAWRPRRGDVIDVAIADPARSGLGRPGVGALSAARPSVLVLVSCDPVSLARDAALLARQGYRHETSEVLDVFPMTHHVEVVTRFVQCASDASR